MKLLNKIIKENDIKKISPKRYYELATEIREFLVESLSKTGGHLASNLGVVELTIALHLYLELPHDKLIWDVGHQSYVHKILTGRKKQFSSLRQYLGMSGFPKVKESECDCFDTGHSSTSISVALGIAKARDISGGNNKVVAVLGDGALTGGLAFEALNNAGRLDSNLIIILNDNNMSISENVGGMANYLATLRTNNKYTGFKENVATTLSKLPNLGQGIIEKLRRSRDSLKHFIIKDMFFEDMGITYIGIIDGHNIEQILKALKTANKVEGAVVIHVITKKGKGFKIAEKSPSLFHGVDPFDINTGRSLSKKYLSYTKVFSNALVDLAKDNEKILAITAAMPEGTGLDKFAKEFPQRFFDVGIAEAHAVTFSAGLASMGYRPVVAIYSTFLQRAYDQIIHDVCINKLPVIFAIDRGGIVGRDGETHQGVFDLSFLSHIPNLVLLAPKDKEELVSMLKFALDYDGPVAIRYNRGRAYEGLAKKSNPIVFARSELVHRGNKYAVFAVGSMYEKAVEVTKRLKELGYDFTLINARFISPIDEELIVEIGQSHRQIFTLEENLENGGFGQKVSSCLSKHRITDVIHTSYAIDDCFVEQGDTDELLKMLELDVAGITKRILKDMI